MGIPCAPCVCVCARTHVMGLKNESEETFLETIWCKIKQRYSKNILQWEYGKKLKLSCVKLWPHLVMSDSVPERIRFLTTNLLKSKNEVIYWQGIVCVAMQQISIVVKIYQDWATPLQKTLNNNVQRRGRIKWIDYTGPNVFPPGAHFDICLTVIMF